MISYEVSRVKLWAAFAAIYVLWGSNFLAIRYAVEEMPPVLMMAARSLMAGTLLFGWARFRRGERPSSGHWRWAAVVGSVLFLGCHGLLAWAERSVPSGLAALVMATIPLWLALLEWATGGATPGSRGILGLMLGFLGLGLLVGPTPGAETPQFGLVILVASAVAWAAGSILSRRVPRSPSLVLASGMQLLCGGASLLVVGLALGEASQVDEGVLQPRALLAFGYMVVVGSVIAFTSYMWLLRVSTPARVGTYAFVNPVVAIFVGWALGGEAIDAGMLGASIVIVAGVALVVTTNANAERGGRHDRAGVEGDDAAGAGRGVPRVPEADRCGRVPEHAR